MSDLKHSIHDVESGIIALSLYLGEIALSSTSEVRNKLIEVLHSLASGEATGTVYADFREPGDSRMFVIANTEEEQSRLVKAFSEQLDKESSTSSTRKTTAIVIPFPGKPTSESTDR